MNIEISDFREEVRVELQDLISRDGISLELVRVKFTEAKLREIVEADPTDWSARASLLDIFHPRRT